MNKLKTILILLIFTLLAIGLLGVNKVYATDTINLSVQNTRPYSIDGKDGDTTAGDDIYEFQKGNNVTDIVTKIYRTGDTSYLDTIYCLRGGVGFGSNSNGTNPATNYTKIADMKSDAADAISSLRSNIDNEETVNIDGKNYSFNPYNAILWMADNMYLPGHTVYNENNSINENETTKQKEELKLLLLKNVGKYLTYKNILDDIKENLPQDPEDPEILEHSDAEIIEFIDTYIKDKNKLDDDIREEIEAYESTYATLNGLNNDHDLYKYVKEYSSSYAVDAKDILTDDDIDVVQQMAIWYFSNYDTNGNPPTFSFARNTNVINIMKINGDDFDHTFSEDRSMESSNLYDCLIDTAVKESSNYGTDNNIREVEIEEPISMGTTTEAPSITYSGLDDSIGPFKIEEITNGYIDYNLTSLKIYDNADEQIPISGILIGANTQQTLENIIEKEFDIKFLHSESYDLTSVKLEIKYNYGYNTTATLWTAAPNPNPQQPAMIIEKSKVEKTLEMQVQNITGKFNLQLEKVDEQGTIISNNNEANFKLFKKGTDIADIVEYTTENGIISDTTLDNIKIESEGQEFIYIINETQAPIGYAGLAEEVAIKIETGLNQAGTAYEVESVTKGRIINGTFEEDNNISVLSVNNVSNLVTITVENKAIEGSFDLQLEKVDEQGERISNVATFNLFENGSTTITDYYTTSGLISGGVFNNIEINTAGQEFVYIISEKQAPIGYLGLSEEVAIKIITGLTTDGTAYEVKDIVEGKIVSNDIGSNSFDEEDNDLISIENESNLITITVANEEKPIPGRFSLKLEKVDSNRERISNNNEAKFDLFKQGSTRTNYSTTNGLISVAALNNIEIESEGQEFIYIINETQAPTGYAGLGEEVAIKITTGLNTAETDYEVKDIVEGKIVSNDIGSNFFDEEDNDLISINNASNIITITVENKQFDLSLRKYITAVNGTDLSQTKVPNITTTQLANGEATTAEYKHRKNAVEVETNDIVTYTISVYNEGQIDGYVKEIVDYLPEGLEFEPTDEFVEEVEVIDKAAARLAYPNAKYMYAFNSTTRELKITSIFDDGSAQLEDTVFGKLTAYTEGSLDSKSIVIECRVTLEVSSNDQILTNIARITADKADGVLDPEDRDSSPSVFSMPSDVSSYIGNDSNETELTDNAYYYEGQQDDDDFDKLVLKGKYFDLSLRKYISKINANELIGDDLRQPTIDTSKLNTIDSQTNEEITTATYTHPKDSVIVKKGDIVTYTIRVYNEGQRDGYVKEIVDYLPDGLGLLLNHNTNIDNLWHSPTNHEQIQLVGENGIYSDVNNVKNLTLSDFSGIDSLEEVYILTGNASITTNMLEDNLIKSYDKETTEDDIESGNLWQKSSVSEDGLYYRDIQVTCIVLKENTYAGVLNNIAEISVCKDENNNDVLDRDSTPNNVITQSYSASQQDDDDFEPIILRYFDLALRKFITKVNDTGITTRVPEVTVNENGNISYIHDKTPIYVANNDIVTYTIRVYNEGSLSGYAEEIKDDIPAGLEFVANNTINEQYGWKMYYEEEEALVETDDITKATIIKTNYLSYAKGVQNNTQNLLNAFDKTQMDIPDYKDVKIAFKIVESNILKENTDRIIINSAEISADSGDDEDSIPDEWNEGEDDQDKEYVYVRYFDLSLLKWVNKTIVTVDSKTTTKETGYNGLEDPEPIVKVELDRKKLKQTVVKFGYTIKITNEGEISGYASEITDYIPAGLEFKAEDNPLWTKDGDNKVTTKALDSKLLNPGESATVDIVYTWTNNAENIGLKTNIAEISEDYNEKGAKDIDSTPDNQIPTEDDQDLALVILGIKTGGMGATYFGFTTLLLAIFIGGVYLIKRYVLR